MDLPAKSLLRVVEAASAYFAAVFALGFVLGTLRVVYAAPAVGEFAATSLEVPLMLTASWVLCGVVLRHWVVPSAPSIRLFMGAVAFMLLISSEIYFATELFDRDVSEQLRTMTTGAGVIGLISQLIFAAFPVLRAWPHAGR
jgi:hypothetical protein